MTEDARSSLSHNSLEVIPVVGRPTPSITMVTEIKFLQHFVISLLYVVIHSKVNAFLSISVSMCILKLLLENNSLSTQTILCTVFTVQGYVLHSLDSISVVCFTLCVFHHSSAVIVKYHYISLLFFTWSINC